MAAANYDFSGSAACEQGATFRRVIECQTESGGVFDLTGYAARMKVRTVGRDVLLSLTTANEKIVIDLVAGTLELILLSAETAAIPFGVHFYDLELAKNEGNSNEDVVRLLSGKFTVSQEVTA